MVMIFYLISSVYFYLFTINLLLFFLLFISCLNLSLDFFFLITIYLLCIISSFILNLLFGFILFGFLNYFSPLAHYSFHCAFFSFWLGIYLTFYFTLWPFLFIIYIFISFILLAHWLILNLLICFRAWSLVSWLVSPPFLQSASENLIRYFIYF